MRRRILSAVLAAVVAAIVILPAAAGAQEEPGANAGRTETTRELGHDEEECIKLLEEGKSVNDCQEAPSPILPAKNELIWGIISFVALLAALYKFAWPGLKKGMDDRTARIRSDLDAAESQRAEAEGILARYHGQLADAKNQSVQIIEEARQTADAMKRDLAARAQADIAEMRQKAAADIESAKVQAIADLRGEVATLAIGAAEQVVGRNLDRETNEALVENYINTVAASN